MIGNRHRNRQPPSARRQAIFQRTHAGLHAAPAVNRRRNGHNAAPIRKITFGTDLHAEFHARAACHSEILRAAVIPAILEISFLVGQVIFLVPRCRTFIHRFPDIGLVAPAPIIPDHRSRSANCADTKVAQTGDPRLMYGDSFLPGLRVGHGIGDQPWRETHFGKEQKIAACFTRCSDNRSSA